MYGVSTTPQAGLIKSYTIDKLPIRVNISIPLAPGDEWWETLHLHWRDTHRAAVIHRAHRQCCV